MPTLSIDHGVSFQAEAGENIYEILSRAGLMEGPCGGDGRCGKCRVRFLTECDLANGEERFFSKEEIEAGWRLSCLHIMDGDCTIALPEEEVTGNIMVGGHRKEVRPDVGEGIGLAVDIGTTTIAAALLDLSSGEQLAKATCLNSQKIFGQDVITRIDHCREEGALEKMRSLVWGDLKKLTEEVCREAGIKPKAIKDAAVAANNVMTHLFAGYDPASLAAYPFDPAFEGSLLLDGAELGLNCSVYCLPSISAYVGGDISAGLLTCELGTDNKTTLFIDIGTNGEMALAHNGRIVSCACAAGPALEGMDISCGMRAAAGAIEDVKLISGVPALKVIGNAAPKGLCGSGLLSLISALVKETIIGKNGRLQKHPLVQDDAEGKKRFILRKNPDLYLTQRDVRQVQLAKGAILAGVDILLEQCGVSASEVDQTLVAGQFGAHLSADSLIGAGLLPVELQNSIRYVGNTSLAGAGLCLLSRKERALAEELYRKVEYLELSSYNGYEMKLMKAMSF